MKRYTAAPGRVGELEHPHPERTAYRDASPRLGAEVVFQVWSNRAAMVKTIRMQERAAPHWSHWSALVKPRETEGY